MSRVKGVAGDYRGPGGVFCSLGVAKIILGGGVKCLVGRRFRYVVGYSWMGSGYIPDRLAGGLRSHWTLRICPCLLLLLQVNVILLTARTGSVLACYVYSFVILPELPSGSRVSCGRHAFRLVDEAFWLMFGIGGDFFTRSGGYYEDATEKRTRNIGRRKIGELMKGMSLDRGIYVAIHGPRLCEL